MILILSEEGDLTCQLVCEWLHYLKKPFLRINKTERIRIKSFYLSHNKTIFKFRYRQKVYSLNEFSSIWYRRGWFLVEFMDISTLLESNLIEDTKFIEKFVNDELNTFMKYIYNADFKSTKIFGNVTKYGVNKLKVLEIANQLGLKTPETMVTTSRLEVENFIEKHGKLISKAIKENVSYVTKTKAVYYLNKGFTEVDLKNLPNQFQISLFQRYYEKQFEVRSFIFKSRIHSIAIFSQSDKQTSEDYRNYNNLKPTRCVPFILPSRIEKKLLKLIKEIGLNTGSVDMIYTKSFEFVLLEINPVGQFGAVSKSMNSFIEKQIAMEL